MGWGFSTMQTTLLDEPFERSDSVEVEGSLARMPELYCSEGDGHFDDAKWKDDRQVWRIYHESLLREGRGKRVCVFKAAQPFICAHAPEFLTLQPKWQTLRSSNKDERQHQRKNRRQYRKRVEGSQTRWRHQILMADMTVTEMCMRT